MKGDIPAHTKSCTALVFFDRVDENTNNERLVVVVPNDSQTSADGSVVLHGDFHAFARPFDWVIKQGRRDPGKITYYLLELKEPQSLSALFSLSVAGSGRRASDPRLGGRRVLIFPGWGPEMLFSGVSEKRRNVGTHAHHITIEANRASGRITSHITPVRDLGGNPIWARVARNIRMEGRESLLVGTLMVKRPQALDPSGIIVTRTNIRRQDSTAQIEESLMNHLSERHPILELPPGLSWTQGYHLQAHFIVSPSGRLDERAYPVLTVRNPRQISQEVIIPDETMYRFTKIELTATANFIVAYGVVPGTLANDFFWL
jgi:hypothetical protein